MVLQPVDKLLGFREEVARIDIKDIDIWLNLQRQIHEYNPTGPKGGADAQPDAKGLHSPMQYIAGRALIKALAQPRKDQMAPIAFILGGRGFGFRTVLANPVLGAADHTG